MPYSVFVTVAVYLGDGKALPCSLQATNDRTLPTAKAPTTRLTIGFDKTELMKPTCLIILCVRKLT
jgi:hypothetical protein